MRRTHTLLPGKTAKSLNPFRLRNEFRLMCSITCCSGGGGKVLAPCGMRLAGAGRTQHLRPYQTAAQRVRVACERMDSICRRCICVLPACVGARRRDRSRHSVEGSLQPLQLLLHAFCAGLHAVQIIGLFQRHTFACLITGSRLPSLSPCWRRRGLLSIRRRGRLVWGRPCPGRRRKSAALLFNASGLPAAGQRIADISPPPPKVGIPRAGPVCLCPSVCSDW